MCKSRRGQGPSRAVVETLVPLCRAVLWCRCDTDVRKDLYQHVVLTGEEGRGGVGEGGNMHTRRLRCMSRSTDGV